MEEKENLSDAFEEIFGQGGSADEDMLKTATKYTLRLSPQQNLCLSFIKFASEVTDDKTSKALKDFYNNYLELKQYCNSQNYVMRLYDFISLRRYLGSGLDIKVQK